MSLFDQSCFVATKALKHAAQRMRHFVRCSKGVSAVEFALVVPLMLTFYVGAVELTQVATVDRKVTLTTAAVGDLVSREDSTVSTSQLIDYLDAARVIMSPYDDNTMRQVVTAVSVDASGNATVLWSYGHQGGVAKTPGSSFSLPTEMADISRNGFVIVSTADYPYTVGTQFFFENAFNLGEEQYFLVRNGQTISLI